MPSPLAQGLRVVTHDMHLGNRASKRNPASPFAVRHARAKARSRGARKQLQSCEGMHLLLCPCLTRAKRPISFSAGRSMSSRSASKPTAPTGERMRHPSKQPFPAPPVSARPQDHVIPSGPWTINHRRHSIRSPQNTNPEANKSAQTSNCIACYTASSSSY